MKHYWYSYEVIKGLSIAQYLTLAIKQAIMTESNKRHPDSGRLAYLNSELSLYSN